MAVKKLELLNDLLDHLKGADTPTVLFFYTEWAEQCRALRDVIDDLSDAFPDLVFWAVDAEGFPDISARYSVKAVPTIVAIRPPDSMIGRVEGAKIAEITSLIQSLGLTEDVDEYCRSLVRQHRLMLFIKGTVDAPRCGFTGQLLSVLKAAGITDYKTFNILEDERVRQRLKELSQWPTYPQVYYKGELLGGLDIIREMHESGELARVLSG